MEERDWIEDENPVEKMNHSKMASRSKSRKTLENTSEFKLYYLKIQRFMNVGTFEHQTPGHPQRKESWTSGRWGLSWKYKFNSSKRFFVFTGTVLKWSYCHNVNHLTKQHLFTKCLPGMVIRVSCLRSSLLISCDPLVCEVIFLSILLPRYVCTVSLVSVSNLGSWKNMYNFWKCKLGKFKIQSSFQDICIQLEEF